MSPAPLTSLGLARAAVLRRRARTVFISVLIAVLACVLCGGSLVLVGLTQGSEEFARRLGADVLVVPSGYDNELEEILLRGEPSTLVMRPAWERVIAETEGVAAVSPQLFIASLRAGCCAASVQLMGFDPETDFVVTPWIGSALSESLTDDQIVVGSKLTAEPGDKLKFFGRNYTVAARMDHTGSGFDTSVFMTMSAARVAAQDRAELTGDEIAEDAISTLTVKVAPGVSPEDVADEITISYRRTGGVKAVASNTIVAEVSSGLNAISTTVVVFATMLWLFGVVVLGVIFAAMLNERRREFGILRSLGATGRKLAGLVMLESALVSARGAVGGGFLALLLILPFRTLIGQTTGLPYIQPSWTSIAVIVIASLLATALTGPLAALASAWRVAAADSYLVIRQEG